MHGEFFLSWGNKISQEIRIVRKKCLFSEIQFRELLNNFPIDRMYVERQVYQKQIQINIPVPCNLVVIEFQNRNRIEPAKET